MNKKLNHGVDKDRKHRKQGYQAFRIILTDIILGIVFGILLVNFQKIIPKAFYTETWSRFIWEGGNITFRSLAVGGILGGAVGSIIRPYIGPFWYGIIGILSFSIIEKPGISLRDNLIGTAFLLGMISFAKTMVGFEEYREECKRQNAIKESEDLKNIIMDHILNKGLSIENDETEVTLVDGRKFIFGSNPWLMVLMDKQIQSAVEVYHLGTDIERTKTSINNLRKLKEENNDIIILRLILTSLNDQSLIFLADKKEIFNVTIGVPSGKKISDINDKSMDSYRESLFNSLNI